MDDREKRLFEFGPFRLDATERTLMRDGVVIQLTPKASETLLILVQDSRHVLTKDEMMSKIWPDSFVEEANLTQNVSILRKALGDNQNGNRFRETVPKKGYPFVATVKIVSQDEVEIIGEGLNKPE